MIWLIAAYPSNDGSLWSSLGVRIASRPRFKEMRSQECFKMDFRVRGKC